MSERSRLAIFGLAALIATTTVFAQNVSLLTFTKEPATTTDNNPTELSLPLGAAANVSADSADEAGAGALLGFQVSKEDRSFLAAFFSLAAAQKVSGTTPDFGAFLLNPTTEGNSFYMSGNYLFRKQRKELKLGVAGRAGLTKTTWEATLPAGVQSVDGFVAYLEPAFLLATRTIRTGPVTTDVEKATQNKYQFGIEIGPTWRFLGGDLAQNDSFLAAPEVLGMSDHRISGHQITFWARLNSAQPFLRVTRFDTDSDIPGFSGTQATIGVTVVSAVFHSETNP